MTKKRKRMLIWILAWAGLLLVVLYSPVGSPDFYSTQNYIVVNHSANDNKGTVLNAPKSNFASDNNSGESGIPDITSEITSTHRAGGFSSGYSSPGGSSYGNMQTQSYLNNNGGSGGPGSGGSFIASGGSRSSSGSSGITMINGITTISTTSDLSSANKQSVSAEDPPHSGGTDPGGDPTGDPIPVGEGWGLLVLFGGIYIYLKLKLTH